MARRSRVGLAVCLAVLGLAAVRAGAVDVVFFPPAPTFCDTIHIEIHGCTQGGTLHWGVNARGNNWQKADRVYWPPGSVEQGVATRTRLEGPDSNGVCRATLGPFDNPAQAVGTVDFALQWDDGSWDTRQGIDYHVPVSAARVAIEPEQPTLNDPIVVTVHDSAPGGQLRWGVNAQYGRWHPPASCYRPYGTLPSDDGLAVDTPLPPPDSKGRSTVKLGPFNRAEQVVTGLHMAVHWGDRWETDFGRNYNVGISPDADPPGPLVHILSPTNGQMLDGDLAVRLEVVRAMGASLWLDDQPLVTLLAEPFEFTQGASRIRFGRHELLARAISGHLAAVDMVTFWRVPPVREEALPAGARLGATVEADNTVLFALYAPGKRFVSVVGDFNGWDPDADLTKRAPDGTWWLRRRLEPGTNRYQYCVDGTVFLADPYATDIEWVDAAGMETHLPELAKSVVKVQMPPFEWHDGDYHRPPLDQLLIYELFIDDFCPGQGYTGLIARLDYIRDLGVTAIEPLPCYEFPGGWSWGYNPAFHMAPESVYGTPGDFKRFVDEAHRRGLAVIMDMVLNHTDYKASLFRLYGMDYDASPYYHLFLGENWGMPDLDQESAAFKRYVADALRCWIEEFHCDGFRYDATRWVGWEGYNDWGASWFAYAGKQADAGTYQIAEHLPIDPDLMNRTEMDSGWHAYFRWRVRDMLMKAELERGEFAKLMDPLRLGFSNALQRVAYVESHDEERVMKDLRESGLGKEEMLNRALTSLAVLLTAPGIPMLYAGEEFGEASNRALAPNPLHWDNLDARAYRALHDHTAELCRLRRDHPALRGGTVRFDERPLPEGVAVYERGDPAGVLVAVNFGRSPQAVSVNLREGVSWVSLFEGPARVEPVSGRLGLRLPPGGTAVLAAECPAWKADGGNH